MIRKTFHRKTASKEIPPSASPSLNTPDPSQSSLFFPFPPAWLKDSKGVLIGLGLGIILSLAMSRVFVSERTPELSPSPSVATTPEIPPKSVTLAAVRSESVQRSLKATGSVAAVEPIDLYAQASNLQIRQVLVDEGEQVEVGQVLVLLDDSMQKAQLMQSKAKVSESEAKLAELQAGSRPEEIAQANAKVNRVKAELEQAKADLKLAQMRVQRNLKLQEEGAIALDLLDGLKNTERTAQAIVSQTQAQLVEAQEELQELKNGPRPEVIEQAIAQLADAKAQYQMSVSAIRDTKIFSPVSGKISQRDARVGNVTNPGQKLFTIIENGKLELRLKVPETQLPNIRPGQTVIVTSDADKSLNIKGIVREIEPRVDETSRQGIVRVDLPTVANLKPGMFLRGAIITDQLTSLTIPMQAVLPQSDGNGQVYVWQPDNTVKRVNVRLGEILSQGRVEALSGVQSGDYVAVKGAAYLNDGDPILINSYQ